MKTARSAHREGSLDPSRFYIDFRPTSGVDGHSGFGAARLKNQGLRASRSMSGRVTVYYRGQPRSASPDLPVWMALSDDRLGIIQRSVRYHRPRAPFCGVGYCTQCLIRVNGQPNVRACEYRPREGDRIESENAWPSPRHDVYGLIDRLFPGGIDTVHGFRRPAMLTPLYHRAIRRLAGFGTVADRPPTATRSGDRLETDALIVGGGRAGAAAARVLAAKSARTIMVDDTGRGPSLFPVPSIAGRAVFLPRPDSAGPFPFEVLVAREDGTGAVVAARQVLLAPGGYDANLVFSGNDRPGVMTAEGAFRLTPGDSIPPFSAALVFGGDSRAREVVERFPKAIRAVAAPGAITPELARSASDRGIRLYPKVILSSAGGTRRVRSATLVPRGTGAAMQLGVDAIILAHRRLPNPQLLFQAGARMHWANPVAHYLPDLDDVGRTSIPGLFAAGEVAGFPETESAEASGTRAAEAMASGGPGGAVGTGAADPHPNVLEGYYREFLARRTLAGKCVVCPCEDVLLEEVVDASRSGYRGVEVIKRFTGVGTGLCQGRFCVPETLLLLAALERRPPAEVGFITQRPPVVPVPLGLLANLPVDP